MYAICRVEKVKAAAVSAMQFHNDREPGRHSNQDIDPARLGENAERVAHGAYQDEIAARIGRYRTSTRKVRKDAVVLVEGIATASPEFFEGKTRGEVLSFFDDVYAFCAHEFGERNIVHFTLHMDESTPHVHFGFVPLKDGALSWKKFFDGKASLSAFQDRYWEAVGRRWGLDRGERSEESGRTHKNLARMKRDSSRELRALQEETRKAREGADRAHDEARAAARELHAIETELAKRRARAAALDGELAEKTAAIGGAKAELAQIFSARDAAKRDAESYEAEAVRFAGEADDANRERDEARAELESLRAEIGTARDELEQVRVERDVTAAEHAALGDELAAMRDERRQLTEELAKLRERVRTFVSAARSFVSAMYERGLGQALAELLAPSSDNPLIGEMFDRADTAVAQGRVEASRYDDAIEGEGYEVLDGEAQLIDADAEWLGERVGKGGEAR